MTEMSVPDSFVATMHEIESHLSVVSSDDPDFHLLTRLRRAAFAAITDGFNHAGRIADIGYAIKQKRSTLGEAVE